MACATFSERKIGMLTAPDTFLNREIYQYDDGNAATRKILYFVVKETTFSMDECWGNKGNMGKFSPSNIG